MLQARVTTVAADPPLLSAALEVCPDSFALVEDAQVLYANRSFALLFGYRDGAEIRGRALADFLPADHLCTQSLAAGSTRGYGTLCGYPGCEFQGRRRDGMRVSMEAACAPFCVGDRRLLVIAARDISQGERRRVAREGEKRFQTIFEAAAIGIGHCTLDGRIVECNAAMERMFGYEHDQLRGLQFSRLTLPADAASDEIQFRELLAGQRDSYQIEKRYIRADRSLLWGYLTLSLVRGPVGEAEFAIAMIEDITQRKQAEQQLQEAQKMEAIGRLVGGVAHDFNNLLTGITLYCDLLLAGLDKDGPLRHHAEEIRIAGQQGAALIQQLLTVARQQVVEPQLLSLNQVISGMSNLLSRLIGENIRLVTKLAPDLSSVRMDPAQCQQVILNLVLNARDAMPKGGRITVETGNGGGLSTSPAGPQISASESVWLKVSDTGCGMDAITRSRLFEPFFTTKAPGRGNGLGLATVRNILKQCGGNIQVRSELDQGTEIEVHLPAVQTEPAPSLKPVTVRRPGRQTVLLVEDNPTVRGSIQRVLSDHGYRVLEACGGVEALKICRRHSGKIHLLLVDLVMPDMSGREVARQVRSLRPEVRVLYTSGYDHSSISGHSEGTEVVPFRKPFTGTALLRKVQEVLSHNHPARPKRKKR